MTKEEWAKAEQALGSIFGHVKFVIDGYKVSVGYVKESPTKYCLAVYIDGIFKSEWCFEDCEIRRRFCNQCKTAVIKKTEFINKFGKREYNRVVKEHPEYFFAVYYTPYFGSFRTLKSHLIKHNDSIELAEKI